MIVRAGNFFFHYRNALFPFAYGLLFVKSYPVVAHYRYAALAGLGIALLGQVLRATTIGADYIRRGGKGRQVYASHLVKGGIFAHCRNPLYVGNFLILLGLGFASNSLIFLGLAIPFFAFAYWAIIAAEEDYLKRKFGQEFDQYCARVNRFLPDFWGLRHTLHGMRINWRRLISDEHRSAYIWSAGITLVVLNHLRMNGYYQTRGPLIWMLCLILILLTLGFAVVRFLKKSGLLQQI